MSHVRSYLGKLRASDGAVAVVLVLTVAFTGTFLEAAFVNPSDSISVRASQRLVSEFGLTDLCLFTEARYTRHPSQADFNTPFQDHPMALEHFPSGALLHPPRNLVRPNADMD